MNLAAVAEDLQAQGHTVTVVTGFPNHPFGKIYDGYQMRSHQWEDVRGVKVLRLPLFPDHSASMARRALNYGSFAVSAALLGSIYTRKIDFDVIFVYLPPLTIGVPVAGFRRRHKVPIVYWMTDVWPEALLGTGASIDGRTYRTIRRIEDWVYSQGTTICVNSPGYKQNLIDKGVPAENVAVVVDWADESLFFPAEPDQSLAQAYGLDGKFNVMYGGNFGPVQALDTVIEAARLTQDLQELQYVFIGDGTDQERLKTLVREYGLANVNFIPRQPAAEIHRFFAHAGALLVHLKDEPLYRIQIPSKIMAYMACGKAILCGVPGSAAEIVRDANAGVFCDPQNAESMAAAVRSLYEMPVAEREKLGENGRQTYLRKYTRSVQTARIEQIIKQAVARSRAEQV